MAYLPQPTTTWVISSRFALNESFTVLPSRQAGDSSLARTPDNTQIYEGTNQIQRMVMARQLLKE